MLKEIDSPPVIGLDDDLLSASKSAKLLMASPSAFCRFALHGTVVNGRCLKIPTIKIGSRRYTTRKAIDWWLEAQQVAQQIEPASRSYDLDHSTYDADDYDREAEDELERLAEREGL